MNSFKTVFALALVSAASAVPIQPSGYELKVQHQWKPMKHASETLQNDWTPVIRSYEPVKQAYAPVQHAYVPVKQAYAPVQHAYVPVKQAYAPVQHAYAPVKQVYTPVKQAYVPVQHAFAPVQHAYAPKEYTKGLGSYGSYGTGKPIDVHIESFENSGLEYQVDQDGIFKEAQNGGYKAYNQEDTVELHGFGGLQDAGYESYGGAEESYKQGDAEASHDDGHAHKDYHSHPAYKFEYGVKDPHTKDHKSQWEHRDGDKVVGEYSLDEADGTKRVVSYTSDKKNGFQAIVKKLGHALHLIH
ncbi:unnamed protein product [Diamesa tonsa]